MTLRQWVIYFRVAYVIVFIPLLEVLIFGSGWSVAAAMAYLAFAVFTLRCKGCDLLAYDHRIATHFSDVATLRACPHCGEPMVPEE